MLARVLVGVVLNAQLAIAAYACPQVTAALAASQSNGEMVALAPPMHHCDEMDRAADAATGNLCIEHCKVGQQSDQAPTMLLPGRPR